MKIEYYVTDTSIGIPVIAEIKNATQFDFQKTVEEKWQTSWLTGFIQDKSLEKYALKIATTGELVGLGAYRDMPEGVLVYVEYIESAPHSNPTLAVRRKYSGIGAALLAYGVQLFESQNIGNQRTLYQRFGSDSVQQVRPLFAFNRR